MQVGDFAYFSSGYTTVTGSPVTHANSPELIGKITAIGHNFIEVSNPTVNLDTPTNAGHFLMFSKDTRVNKNSLIGYYAEVELENDSTDKIEWIIDNVKVSMFNANRCYVYNKAMHEASPFQKHKEKLYSHQDQFELIREWAKERGLYDKGNATTQYVKLQEEAGELAKALLNNDKAEVIDAIGDMVVVLTNLAHLQGVHIETCIAEAYKVISKRTGKMINGTFVKDE